MAAAAKSSAAVGCWEMVLGGMEDVAAAVVVGCWWAGLLDAASDVAAARRAADEAVTLFGGKSGEAERRRFRVVSVVAAVWVMSGPGPVALAAPSAESTTTTKFKIEN